MAVALGRAPICQRLPTRLPCSLAALMKRPASSGDACSAPAASAEHDLLVASRPRDALGVCVLLRVALSCPAARGAQLRDQQRRLSLYHVRFCRLPIVSAASWHSTGAAACLSRKAPSCWPPCSSLGSEPWLGCRAAAAETATSRTRTAPDDASAAGARAGSPACGAAQDGSGAARRCRARKACLGGQAATATGSPSCSALLAVNRIDSPAPARSRAWPACGLRRRQRRRASIALQFVGCFREPMALSQRTLLQYGGSQDARVVGGGRACLRLPHAPPSAERRRRRPEAAGCPMRTCDAAAQQRPCC